MALPQVRLPAIENQRRDNVGFVRIPFGLVSIRHRPSCAKPMAPRSTGLRRACARDKELKRSNCSSSSARRVCFSARSEHCVDLGMRFPRRFDDASGSRRWSCTTSVKQALRFPSSTLPSPPLSFSHEAYRRLNQREFG